MCLVWIAVLWFVEGSMRRHGGAGAGTPLTIGSKRALKPVWSMRSLVWVFWDAHPWRLVRWRHDGVDRHTEGGDGGRSRGLMLVALVALEMLVVVERRHFLVVGFSVWLSSQHG